MTNLPPLPKPAMQGRVEYGNVAAYFTSDQMREYGKACAAVPEGWKLVPIEPTEEMRDAAYEIGVAWVSGIYEAMLNAAPTPEETK